MIRKSQGGRLMKVLKKIRFIPLFLAAFMIAACLQPMPAEAAVSVKEGTYILCSGVGGNKVLDIAKASKANRANAQIYTSNNSNAQKFKIEKVGNYYRIVNVNSGKVLDVAGGSKSNKANVQQYTWNGSKAQLWKFESAGNGAYYIINVKSGKALDVSGGKAINKKNVQQYTANKSKAQKWTLKATKANKTTSSSTSTSAESSNSKPKTYVGSSKATKFHLSTCVEVKNINPENLVTYSSRQDAINHLKEPCKVCKP